MNLNYKSPKKCNQHQGKVLKIGFAMLVISVATVSLRGPPARYRNINSNYRLTKKLFSHWWLSMLQKCTSSDLVLRFALAATARGEQSLVKTEIIDRN